MPDPPIYIISVNRQSKRWAIFDQKYDVVRDFIPYVDEQRAIEEGKAWVSLRSTVEPNVVYPRISRIRVW